MPETPPATEAAPQVDFYLLTETDSRSAQRTACRLAEKACEQGHRVQVRTADAAATAQLDDLLWTFSDRSFVPHCVWPGDPELVAATPVLISASAGPETHRGVLINLAPGVPDDGRAFGRVLEIVAADDDSKRLARARWRTYREYGLDPRSHNL
jgi:DNA polymerase-3 subunit chi